jgi:hypothetical protein
VDILFLALVIIPSAGAGTKYTHDTGLSRFNAFAGVTVLFLSTYFPEGVLPEIPVSPTTGYGQGLCTRWGLEDMIVICLPTWR